MKPVPQATVAKPEAETSADLIPVEMIPVALIPVGLSSSGGKTSGRIRSTDAVARTVTLETGRIYHSETRLDLSNFKSGDHVNVTFTEACGKRHSSAVTLTPDLAT